MARVMLVQPWNYHDESVREHDLANEWRNGPYSLLLLATELKQRGHEVRVCDLIRDLVVYQGKVEGTLRKFEAKIERFRPDIIGFGFFSIHYFEVQRAVEHARRACERARLKTIFIGGGIHASTEPHDTIRNLGFDYAFCGEADLGLVQIADGARPETVQGVVGRNPLAVIGATGTKGEQPPVLDDLPFPDWSLCDYKFYATPSWGKVKVRKTASLDMIMSRGCVYKCAFCAYNALSAVRFYSAEYLVSQIEYMRKDFGVDAVYFTDSTIGNNRRLMAEFSELMASRGLADQVEWHANIRPNQVTEKELKLWWRGGCRYLFYGFESASQRVLDLMVKGCKVEANYKAAELHNRLKFPYHASMLLGYPGEREEDIRLSLQFMRDVQPPSLGVNWYVPLPGSPDYDKLKAEGVITTEDPMEWRRIGEVNNSRVYADVPEDRFRELFAEAERLANVEIPKLAYPAWGCIAPPQSEMQMTHVDPDPASGHAAGAAGA